MLRALSLVLIVLVVNNCGKADDFAGYRAAFEMESRKQHHIVNTSEIDIRFVRSMEGTVIGMCFYMSPRFILINKSWWDRANETQREMVIYHELGHCALNREHSTRILASGAPASIMYPSIFDSRYYAKYKAYYMYELFH